IEQIAASLQPAQRFLWRDGRAKENARRGTDVDQLTAKIEVVGRGLYRGFQGGDGITKMYDGFLGVVLLFQRPHSQRAPHPTQVVVTHTPDRPLPIDRRIALEGEKQFTSFHRSGSGVSALALLPLGGRLAKQGAGQQTALALRLRQLLDQFALEL